MKSLYKRSRCGTEWQLPTCVRCSTVQWYNQAGMSFLFPKLPSERSAGPRSNIGTRGVQANTRALYYTPNSAGKYCYGMCRFCIHVGATAGSASNFKDFRWRTLVRLLAKFLRFDTASYCVLFGFHRTQTKRGNTKGQLNML